MLRRLLRKGRVYFRTTKDPSPNEASLVHDAYTPTPHKTTPKNPSDYVWLHPSLKTDLEHHPLIQAWLENKQPAKKLYTKIDHDLYQLPLLSAECVTMWNEELAHFSRWRELEDVDIQAPNSMNSYGFILEDLNAQPPWEQMMQDVISPISAELFPLVHGQGLDELHSFVVEYGSGLDRDLGFHVDASDVTVNLCLGENFVGNELYFEGRRCELHRQTPAFPGEKFFYSHQPGVAILHAGKHRHGAVSIESGIRRNVILWCSSSTLEEDKRCPSWCPEGKTNSTA